MKSRIKTKLPPPKPIMLRKNALKEYQETIEQDGLAKIVALGSEDCSSTVTHWFSTGSLSLDRYLNGKGIPAGRLTEIFGSSYIGKSLLLDHIMGRCQQSGGVAILVDTETARDVKFSNRLGVDSEKLQVIEFKRKNLTLENVIDKIISTADFWAENYPETPVVIGLDSLGGTAVKDEIDKNLGAADGEEQKNVRPAAAAKVLRSACRKLLQRISGTKIGVVVINHEYANLQIGKGFGKARETYGGDAVRLAASYRIEMFNLGGVKLGDEIVGREVGVKFIKNRFGSPFGQTSILIQPNAGVNNVWDIFTRLKEKEVIISDNKYTLQVEGKEIVCKSWNKLQKLCEETPGLFEKLIVAYNSHMEPIQVELVKETPVEKITEELEVEDATN